MVSYGLATVLQAVGARRTGGGDTLDVGLLVRLAHQGPYLAGLALDVGGVLFTVLALRKLPLFVVQAAIAGSLAVTAVAAARRSTRRSSPGSGPRSERSASGWSSSPHRSVPKAPRQRR